MIYTIRKDLEKDFREEINFTYRYFTWTQEPEDESLIEIKLDCPENVFKKMYGRAVCEKKFREEGRLYVTAAEAEDPVMLEFLQKSRKSIEFTVLSEKETSDYAAEEDERLVRTRVRIPVTGDHAILQEEFHIRFYDSRIFTVDGKAVCIVEDCTEEAAKSIQKRAACMEKTVTSGTGAFFLTLEEAGYLNSYNSPLRKNYNSGLYCLEEDSDDCKN